NPIPVDSIHFTRGAVAIAVNGVPIFNVHTNTGVDSYLDGQLDDFGGHCGRADDYHYHLPPLSLYNYTSTTMPIAFALDGYAVYGSVEPDGTPMQTLDANHGHLFNGVYHYHGTVAAPYMIANMAGVVTEDSTHQIIPQAAAHPVRPSLTPLNGALITSCLPNANNNGYTLIYTLNGQTDSIVYSWTNNGVYSFNFFTAGNGTSTTQTYNGFSQCDLPNALNEIVNAFKSLQIFPNPNNSTLHIQLPESIQEKDVKSISIYDYEGILIYKNEKLIHEIDIKNFAKGVYLINIQFEKNQMTEKFIVD
ncbi:MAG: T9SS type A sorting domain-containing protein, partial [Bacteroidota bacterium]